MSVINDMHVSLLLTGSDDGVVRIWKNPHIQDQQELVSSWFAIRDLMGRRTARRYSQPMNAAGNFATYSSGMSALTSGGNNNNNHLSIGSSDDLAAASGGNGGGGGNNDDPNANMGYAPSFVMDWQQNKGRLVVSGATSVIRVWDAEQEVFLVFI